MRAWLIRLLRTGYAPPVHSLLLIPETLAPDRTGCEVRFSVLAADGVSWYPPIRCGYTRKGCEGQGRHGLGS